MTSAGCLKSGKEEFASPASTDVPSPRTRLSSAASTDVPSPRTRLSSVLSPSVLTPASNASWGFIASGGDLEQPYRRLEGESQSEQDPKPTTRLNDVGSAESPTRLGKCCSPSLPSRLAFHEIGLRRSLIAFVAFFGLLILVWPAKLLWSRPRLWDQALRPEYVNEPLGKKMVRYFDGYLIARAGLDDVPTFEANVNRALSPDVVFESIGWNNGGTPLLTHGRDKWTQSGEERQFRQAFGSTELFTQMMFLGDGRQASTTSYGTLFWQGDLFGIPPPNKWIELRVCDFYRIARDPLGVHGGRITYNFMMIDWADVMHRAGHPVLPAASLEDGLVLPPAANDGVPAPFSILAQNRDVKTARTVMEGILKDDWAGVGTGEHWWHQDLTFYGIRGIGVARNIPAFRDHVLKPFQAAFANRSLVSEILTCEGNYCGALGHIEGTHVATWLGLPPSSKRASIRYGMHCRIVDGKAKEGWAIFDVAGLFNQLGFDFFASAARGSLQPVSGNSQRQQHAVD